LARARALRCGRSRNYPGRL